MAVALAVHEMLRDAQTPRAGLGHDPTSVLERRTGGRIVMAGHRLLRLGDGNFAKGRQFMHAVLPKYGGIKSYALTEGGALSL